MMTRRRRRRRRHRKVEILIVMDLNWWHRSLIINLKLRHILAVILCWELKHVKETILLKNYYLDFWFYLRFFRDLCRSKSRELIPTWMSSTPSIYLIKYLKLFGRWHVRGILSLWFNEMNSKYSHHNNNERGLLNGISRFTRNCYGTRLEIFTLSDKKKACREWEGQRGFD